MPQNITQKDITRIIRRYNAGHATEEEKAFVDAYYSYFGKGAPVADEAVGAEMKTFIMSHAEGQGRVRVLGPFYRYAVAASVVLVLSVTGYFVLHHQTQSRLTALNEIKPGSNGAVLTLANGNKIVLEQTRNGLITDQNGNKVNKANDSLLVYKAGAANSAAITYNTLETPRGKQYAVVLPDGSKAWLNAASSLRYPTAFNGKERLVELTGEGYFEVVHNAKQPFRVKTDDELVEDIGTHFNINTYDDEPARKTTLLEGSVRLTGKNAAIILKPGQQAALIEQKFVVNEVNVQEVVAWKDGYFYFDHADIKEVMRQIARWYNVKVAYQGTLPKTLFRGKIYRKGSIRQVLKVLEFYNVHFRLDGDLVTIIG
ncbi:MAG: FecR family protein [Sphingobacteriales bacterium]